MELNEIKESPNKRNKRFAFLESIRFWKWTAIALVGIFFVNAVFKFEISPRFFSSSGSSSLFVAKPDALGAFSSEAGSIDKYVADVLPQEGVVLPVSWGDLGKKLVDSAVIDGQAFEALYASRGGLNDSERSLLYGSGNEAIKINEQNAPVLLNLLWALGLGNKNKILDNGPMNDPQYGGAGAFASTGGWTLAVGDAMGHYSKHSFIELTRDQQAMVESVSQGIYRPCCGNSTYFPDCNHGMAMLGLLELAASQNVSEQDMYKMALAVNAYWFPETYLTIAKFKDLQGIAWADVSPKEVLGYNYSSSAGYKKIASQVEPVSGGGGGGCGV